MLVSTKLRGSHFDSLDPSIVNFHTFLRYLSPGSLQGTLSSLYPNKIQQEDDTMIVVRAIIFLLVTSTFHHISLVVD
jgi:hypothetical protein